MDNPGPGDGVGITNESEPRRGYRRQSAITNQPWRCRAAQCAARGGRATVCSLLPEGLEERRVAVSAKIYVADQAVVRLIPPALAALAIRNVTYRYVSGPLVTMAGGRDSVKTTIPTRHRRMRPGAVGTAERHPDRRPECFSRVDITRPPPTSPLGVLQTQAAPEITGPLWELLRTYRIAAASQSAVMLNGWASVT